MTNIRRNKLKSVAVSAKTSSESLEILQRGLGGRITDVRIRKDWTQADLARELGVSRDRVSKWERGENAPPLDVLVALRTVLGVSLDELIAGEASAPAQSPANPGQQEELRRVVKGMERLIGHYLSDLTGVPTGVEAQGEKT
jgi:transcriptional regulator with XRE-family HTH domain